MFWLEGLFIVMVFISQMYVIRFQSSYEGKDERGKAIQYKTNNMLFNILYLGVVLLVVLHLVEIVPTNSLPNILLYFLLSISVFGSITTFVNKNKTNY
ncbi:hypothetical protein [Aquibacillus kalidii]|uniref:hypothetical protein n=1 Tax=Aquibacillus kalidii TaxID=2762597 RepID=UPI00164633BC|nr:hypothetical protein [Aquibacillus kalidii]